jgi:hypothetical protein
MFASSSLNSYEVNQRLDKISQMIIAEEFDLFLSESYTFADSEHSTSNKRAEKKDFRLKKSTTSMRSSSVPPKPDLARGGHRPLRGQGGNRARGIGAH